MKRFRIGNHGVSGAVRHKKTGNKMLLCGINGSRWCWVAPDTGNSALLRLRIDGI
jgi:hypothetical protein